jgi:hypothetical protein
MKRALASFTQASFLAAAACSSQGAPRTGPHYANVPEPTLAVDVTPVTDVAQAEPGVVIPYFQSCRAPVPGDTTTSEIGEVCTNVAVPGATEEGKYFPAYASCDVVRTQRPYNYQPPAGGTDAGDPRLSDPSFMSELQWVTSQVRAAACTCCHDDTQAPKGAAEWNINAPGIWTDTASNAAIGLFSGYTDSSVLGHYDPTANNGFERTTTGLPSTDAARMQAFWNNELARRGMTPTEAAALPAFGAPLIAAYRAPPSACAAGIGVGASGTITWGGSPARYVYVLSQSAESPSLPPNGDLPAGTIWRLDVLASADPLASGLAYGTTPKGTFQHVPASGRALALESGTTYHLFVLADIGVVSQNCLFAF